ncbi:MAG: TlpA disulfide reductase family protein [Thermoanaerobaculia bacterium]|nr:TlpA disulfide reductase family protein [Thermoanaerobaculia bacterium]
MTVASILAMAFLLVLPAPSQAQRGEITLPGLDGGDLEESELLQGASIVVIWASWSPRCRDIVERVNALHSRWNDRAKVLTVDFQEDPATIREFLGGKRLRAPVYLDRNGAFSKKNAVTTLPGLLIYKDGQILFRGKLPDDAESLIAQVLG